MNTYELLTAAGHILGDIEDENGEITEATLAGMDEWIDAAEDKLGRIRAVITRTKNEQALLREEEKRLAARRRRLDAVLHRVTDLATSLLQAQEALGNEPKVKTYTYTVSLSRSQSVHVDHLGAVANDWLIHPEPKVDKAGARKAMLAGEEIRGLSLQPSYSLRWK